MKKLILAILVSLFFGGAGLAHASLVINEIMYDLPDSDEGKEWLEVYNSGPENIDLSLYKFFEGDTNHKLVLLQGSSKIEANSYALVVSNPEKFKGSFPSFSGNIFDSSFSLSNTGERLALMDKDLKMIDEVVYSSSMGGGGNGRTISKIDGAWKEGKATMGIENQIYVAPAKPAIQIAPVSKPTVVVEKKVEPEFVKGIQPVESNSITASVMDTEVSSKKETKKSPIYLISMLGLVILGGGTVYLVRRNKTGYVEGDDFEIVE